MEDHLRRISRPRIVDISKHQKSLIDYGDSGEYTPYRRERSTALYRQAKDLFTDHEIKLLVIWAIISPSAGLAYLIWAKYEHLRLLAVVLFCVSVLQFVAQWQGVYTLAVKFISP